MADFGVAQSYGKNRVENDWIYAWHGKIRFYFRDKVPPHMK